MCVQYKVSHQLVLSFICDILSITDCYAFVTYKKILLLIGNFHSLSPVDYTQIKQICECMSQMW